MTISMIFKHHIEVFESITYLAAKSRLKANTLMKLTKVGSLSHHLKGDTTQCYVRRHKQTLSWNWARFVPKVVSLRKLQHKVMWEGMRSSLVDFKKLNVDVAWLTGQRHYERDKDFDTPNWNNTFCGQSRLGANILIKFSKVGILRCQLEDDTTKWYVRRHEVVTCKSNDFKFGSPSTVGQTHYKCYKDSYTPNWKYLRPWNSMWLNLGLGQAFSWEWARMVPQVVNLKMVEHSAMYEGTRSLLVDQTILNWILLKVWSKNIMNVTKTLTHQMKVFEALK